MTNTPCNMCHGNRHAIQYTAIAFRDKPERPAVALVCPRCDSPGAAVKDR